MPIQETRAQLKERSNKVKPLVEAGEFDTINAAVMAVFYLDDDHQEFRKFKQWKKDGFSILKGSKAFPVWGQPAKAEKKKAEGEDEKDEYEFWPICYLFSNAQVEKRKSRQV